MEAAAAKAAPRGHRRQPKKATAAQEGPEEAAGAAPEQLTATEEQSQPCKASPLSQRLTRSIRQSLSQLGAGSKAEDAGDEEGEVQQQQELQKQQPLGAGGRPLGGNGYGAGQEGEGDEGAPDSDAAPPRWQRRLAAARAAVRSPGAVQPAAAALVLLALVLGALCASQWRGAALAAAQHHQLAAQLQALQGQHRAAQQQASELQRSHQRLRAQAEATAAALAALQGARAADSGAAADLAAELAALREAVAHLQLSTAAADGSSPAPDSLAAQHLQQVAGAEVQRVLALFAADRTGLPDYALAAAGGKVLAHSPVLAPSLVARGPGLGRALLAPLQAALSGAHPDADKILLAPLSQAAGCLPLQGATGHVDVRLARAIRPSAWTYEHIPAAVAYNLRSAPANFTLLGFVGLPPPATHAAAVLVAARLEEGAPGSTAATGGPFLLGRFAYDARASWAVQTYQLVPWAGSHVVDHVRLVVTGNHGHPAHTCLYRLRVHGSPSAAR